MGSHRFIDLTGQRFGSWTVRAPGAKVGMHMGWECWCDCGSGPRVVPGARLRGGHSLSCGACPPRTHGEGARGRQSPEYLAWLAMRKRCRDKGGIRWDRYGGRGIRVCDEWERSYETFLAGVGRKPTPSHSLDRINNDGNYEPGNVRWATRREQAENRVSSWPIWLNGERTSACRAAATMGRHGTTVCLRLNAGYDLLSVFL